MDDEAIKLAEAKCLSDLQFARQVSKGDPEAAHVRADRALLDFLSALGYKHLVDEFDKVEMWYS